MLRSLHMKDVGPAARFDLELGERLNALTGDNGLGKSFVLDVAWWVLTGTWISRPVLPEPGCEEKAEIEFQLDLPNGNPKGRLHRASFRRARQDWEDPIRHNGSRSSVHGSGLWIPGWLEDIDWAPVLYARADGAFSVWDPARNYPLRAASEGDLFVPRPYHLGIAELWDGLELDGKPICNGLIHDWTRWWLEEASGKRSTFELLRNVLRRLSHPLEPMEPGEPRRLYLDDVRDYPTFKLPYGNVSLAQLSAGMRRIVGLAYLIVWAWTEHQSACTLLGREPASRVVFLMDEAESHLHPQWQRHIAPSLLGVLEGLSAGMRPQVLMTTHSPMVLASLEPHFNVAKDKLFLFDLEGREVTLRETPWAKRGDAVAWLTSPIFGLEQASSIEAERAIESAHKLMEGNVAALPEGLRTEDEIERELRRVLGDQAPFLIEWKVWREHRIR